MRVNFLRWGIALIAVCALVALGLRLWSGPSPLEVAPAGAQAGVAGACAPGSRTGLADLDDDDRTPDGLRIMVRTPSDYDPTRAYPLLVVFPPAGYDRRQSEIFYDLTPEATRRGFIVAYSDHRRLSRRAVAQQAKVAATVEVFFCVDPAQVSYLGHSDGGSMAEGIPTSIPGVAPRAIVASAAGIAREDLAAMACPSVSSVLIVHNRSDPLFPDFGRGAVAYWSKCAACAPTDLDAIAEGCVDFSGCAKGRRVTYCESAAPHTEWPDLNGPMLDFIQGEEAKF